MNIYTIYIRIDHNNFTYPVVNVITDVVAVEPLLDFHHHPVR